MKWKTYLDSIMRFPLILSSLPRELLNVSWTQKIAIIKKKQIFIFANLFCHWGFKVEPLSFYELWNLFTQHLGNLPDSKNQRKKHVWRRASSSHLKVEIPRHRHKWIFCLVWTFEFIYTIWSVILSYTKLEIFYHIHSCQNCIISSGTDEFRVW